MYGVGMYARSQPGTRGDGRLEVRAPLELIEELRRMAERHDRSMGWEVRRAVAERLERDKAGTT
jgi:predicted transcriptional regulator